MPVITRSVQRDLNHMYDLLWHQQSASGTPEKINAAIQTMKFVTRSPSIHQIIRIFPTFRTVLIEKCREIMEDPNATLELEQLCNHILCRLV